MANQRLIQFDSAKGLAIFSVVLIHLNNFLGIQNHLMAHIIVSYYMPIFFLISGFFGYKSEISGYSLLLKRFKELILPYLTIGILINLLACKLFELSFFDHYLFDESKGGFWFLLVLFFFYILYFTARKLSKSNDNMMFAILLIFYVISFVVCAFSSQYYYSLLSLPSIRKYLPFFIVGLFLRKIYYKHSLFSNTFFFISCILYGITILLPFDKTYLGQMVWSVCALSGSVLILNIFKRYRLPNKPFASMGQFSLTIYIYHYDFMYIIKAITPPPVSI